MSKPHTYVMVDSPAVRAWMERSTNQPLRVTEPELTMALTDLLAAALAEVDNDPLGVDAAAGCLIMAWRGRQVRVRLETSECDWTEAPDDRQD